MFRNYLTIALRNIARNRVFSLINIVGLSIGLACCLLILLYARDELSFDRFQQNNAQLYRITRHLVDKKHSVDMTMGISGMIQGPAFKSAIPGIAAYVRTNPNRLTLRNGKEIFQQWVTWVDDNFFTVFLSASFRQRGKSADRSLLRCYHRRNGKKIFRYYRRGWPGTGTGDGEQQF